jgi:hypothetical protein
LNGVLSGLGGVTTGVPQGSILGPLLFCIFINDLPLHIQNPHVYCEMFADDSSLHSTSPSIDNLRASLQAELSNVCKWSSSNKMVIHPSKTKSMIITSRQKHQKAPLHLNLILNLHPVEQVKCHRVLGITIDEELKWQIHINKICKTVARNVFFISSNCLLITRHDFCFFAPTAYSILITLP